MKIKLFLAASIMSMTSTAWAENWIEVYRDKLDIPDGATYFIDRDSLKVKRGVVFFMSKTQERLTRKFSIGNDKYDYQIGEYAVDCKDKSMTGLGNAFYLKGGHLVGELPVNENVVFDKTGLDKSLFDKVVDADSAWAKKINYACNWMKKKDKN